LLFTGEKLNIVHDKNVVFPVSLFKLISLTDLQGVHVINSKSFGGNVKNLFRWVVLFDIVPHCLGKMGFTSPCVSVYKQWIISNTWVFHNCLGGCVGKFIERTNNKSVECIFRIKIIFLTYVMILKRHLICRRRLFNSFSSLLFPFW